MGRVHQIRKRLRSIRCSLKQRDGKFVVSMWPRKQGQKKMVIKTAERLDEVDVLLQDAIKKS